MLAPPVSAQQLSLPFPVLAAYALEPEVAGYALPTAPWAPATGLPIRMLEGVVDQRAWQLDTPRLSLLEILAPLREQLLAQGYAITLDCTAKVCGGFDFRFATTVLPEPHMHVDIGDFRFLSAERQGPDGPEGVSLLVSRSGRAGFVQVVHVGPSAMPETLVSTAQVPEVPTRPGGSSVPAAASPDDALATLDSGHALVLEGLEFASGSASLSQDSHPVLETLAAWLAAHPDRHLMLVGHTDASGALPANVELSRQRAEAVRQALIKVHGIAPTRLDAEGVGPLAPRADVTSPEGRALNRRVEAVPG